MTRQSLGREGIQGEGRAETAGVPRAVSAASGESDLPKARVVLIMGYGRSGGSILGLALGSASGALTVGEIVYFQDVMREERPAYSSRAIDLCSCGSPIAACPFWTAVNAALPSSAEGSDSPLVGGILKRAYSLPWAVASELFYSPPALVVRSLSRSSELRRQFGSQEQLLRTAARISGGRTLIDTSRNPERSWYYRFMPNVEVRYIHLVRDGRATLEGSFRHPDAGELDSPPVRHTTRFAAVVSLGWTYYNVVGSILGLIAGKRYLRVRYEDLQSDPAASLRRIGNFLELDLEPVIQRVEKGGRLEPGHFMCGNRSKFDPVFRTGEEGARMEAPVLPGRVEWVFALSAGWLRRLLGYSKDRPPRAP